MRLSFLIFIFSFIYVISFSQNKNVININGSFYDDSTGLDLPTTVYGIRKGEKKYLGKSSKEEMFNHKFNISLELGIDSLVFESPGYQTKVFPVYFHGEFKKDTKFQKSVKTMKGNEVAIYKTTEYICSKGSPNRFEMMYYKGGNLHSIGRGENMFFKSEAGINSDFRYVLLTFSPKNEVLSEVTYKLLPGINFLDVNDYEQVKLENKKEEIIKPIIAAEPPEITTLEQLVIPSEAHPFEKSGIPNLYFEQGKFELNIESIKLLDEILKYFNQNQDYEITVKGFTDGVGDKVLNETLAKYRAQVVAGYLKNNGMDSGRINVEWEKENVSEKNLELHQYRKVTISKIR